MTDELLNTHLGEYYLTELVRRGGMATVYKAHQPSLDRFVAVKVLFHNRDPQFAARFKREARAIAQLQHPNILPIYNYGEQEGLLYLVLQYVEHGTTLTDKMGLPMPPLQALRLTTRLLGALEYAHVRGIIHRDIKPANVLLPTPDWPMLADFGIAKLLNDTSQQLTVPGLVVGTATYMAPEQATGRQVNARTDIYATGVILYEMLTGRVPFDADTPMAVLTQHIYEAPPPPSRVNPSIPVTVEAAVLRALAKDPADRYQSAAEMAEALDRVAIQLQQTDTRSRLTGLYQIGVQAFVEGQWEQAVEHFGKLVALDPTYEDSADLLSAAREARERAREEARQQIEQVRLRRSTLSQNAPAPRISEPGPPATGETSRYMSEPGPPATGETSRYPASTTGPAVPPAPATGETSRFDTGELERSLPPTPAVKKTSQLPAAEPAAPATSRLDTGELAADAAPAVPGLRANGSEQIAPASPHVAGQVAPPRNGRLFLIIGGLVAIGLLLVGLWSANLLGGGTGARPTSLPTTGLPAPTSAQAVEPGATAPATAPADVPIPPPAGKLVFEDNFDTKGEKSGLEDNLKATDFSRGFHPPGVYHIIPKQPNTADWVMLPRIALGDFSMQIQVWDDSDELRGGLSEGVLFRARDMNHFYALLIDPRNGKYTVQKYNGLNNVVDLIPWKDSPIVAQQKEKNLIRVDAKGATFTIYLNGKQLDTFNEDAYRFGMLGLIANNQDAVNPHPHFDQLTIWRADEPLKLPDLPATREDPAGDMVLIPGGEFILGGNLRPDSQTHILSLPSFYIDRNEVTNSAYQRCVADSKCGPPQRTDSPTHPTYFGDPAFKDFPVINVTWDQAQQFCGWANKRLPSEAEWEKAASWNAQERTKVLYPWGNTFDPARLNSEESQRNDAVQIGSFPAEINGTFDMAGNVYEWTNSLMRSYPFDEADGREENPSPGDRVFRGGSFAQTEGKARVYDRRQAAPDYSDREIGFRCAATP